MVGFNLQVVGLEFYRHMPVAQMVGGTNQIEWCAVLGAVADVQNRLRCGNHPHQRAVLRHQHIATTHHSAPWQEDAQLPTCGVGGLEAALLAQVPVQFDGTCAFEQYRRQAAALCDEFGSVNHESVLWFQACVCKRHFSTTAG